MFEKCNHFYVRYYTTVDGVRKQKAEPLCEKDDKHHSKKCKAVRLKLDEFMLKVNSREESADGSPTVAEFWTGTYLPFAEKHLRASTVSSYKDLWQRHLKPHFGSTRLSDYRPVRATAHLTKLSESLGRNALNHVRSLMSGVFSHAAALGHVEHNPMRDAKVLAKTKAPSNTPHYSLEELAAIISALSGDPAAPVCDGIGWIPRTQAERDHRPAMGGLFRAHRACPTGRPEWGCRSNKDTRVRRSSSSDFAGRHPARPVEEQMWQAD